MAQPKEYRPVTLTVANSAYLMRWNWQKDEMAAGARRHRLKANGPKFEIAARIGYFRDDGPNLGKDNVRLVWTRKQAQPTVDGQHRYHPSDLKIRPGIVKNT